MLPNFASFVLGTAGNHVKLKTDTATPCHIAHPVVMLSYCLFSWRQVALAELPNLYMFVVAATHNSLLRKTKLLVLVLTAFSKHSWLS